MNESARPEVTTELGGIPWEYRVAQNPRPMWFAASAFFAFFAVSAFGKAGSGGRVDDVVSMSMGVVMACLAIIVFPVAGYTNLIRPKPLTGVVKRIEPTGFWSLFVPMALFLGAGGVVSVYNSIHEVSRPGREEWARMQWALIAAIMIGFLLGSIIWAGWHRRLTFTPEALEYERGRFFKATIPWDAMLELTEVADANIGNGGLGDVNVASRRNLRAGVRIVPGPTAQITGKTMLKKHAGVYGVGVDCSSYRTDPNTLINAIFLLAEHPELRPLLATPEGSVLFEGPSFATRKRMKVGDRWDRRTDRVIGMGTIYPENR